MRNRPLRLRGGGLLVRQVYLVHVVDLLSFWLQPDGQETLYVKGVSLVAVRQILVVGVLRDVVLVRQEGPDAAQLQDALAAVQDRQLVHAGKLFATMSSDEFKMVNRTIKKAANLFRLAAVADRYWVAGIQF